MIIIQAILIFSLLIVAANFIGSRKSSRTKAVKKLILLLTIPAAIFVVVFPNMLTKLANQVGVGRGADLLVYSLTMFIIFNAFDQYIKNMEEQRRTAIIVRKMAIMEALTKQKTDK